MAYGEIHSAPSAWLVFWTGFLVCFTGIWLNIAAVQALPELINQQQVIEPADGEQSHEPLNA